MSRTFAPPAPSESIPSAGSIHNPPSRCTSGTVAVGMPGDSAVMNTDSGPFLGSEALAAGALTRYELRRYYRAILPNVYVEKHLAPCGSGRPQRGCGLDGER